MKEPRRPVVGFRLEVRSAGGARLVPSADDGLWMPFPGGADWPRAVADGCRERLGALPVAVTFTGLVDDGNREAARVPWIGAAFRVVVPDGTPAPTGCRWE